MKSDNPMILEKKVVRITGGSRGVGLPLQNWQAKKDGQFVSIIEIGMLLPKNWWLK